MTARAPKSPCAYGVSDHIKNTKKALDEGTGRAEDLRRRNATLEKWLAAIPAETGAELTDALVLKDEHFHGTVGEVRALMGERAGSWVVL